VNRAAPAWLAAGLAALLAGCPGPPADGARYLSKAESDRLARERFDPGRYVRNDFQPAAGAAPPAPAGPRRTLRVGLQWLMTGDAAPWVVAQRLGFFAEQGLEVAIEEGGPGRDVLSGVVMGRLDVYVGYPEVALAMMTSRTGADLRMIGASMKSSGVGFMGLDRTIPRDQRSTRRITAADLAGRRVGIQPGADFLIDFLCDQTGLRRSSLQVMSEGPTPDALVAGALDYYQGLLSDQPRLLERQGYRNWTFLSLADVGYACYMDVSVVTAEFCAREPAILRRYLAALDRSLRYIAAHPAEAARIMVQAIPKDPGSEAEMEARIRRESAMSRGDGTEPLLFMDPARVRDFVSILFRYHRIDSAGAVR